MGAFAPAQQIQSVDVPLSLFGGMHTGVAPPDLTEGLSPDNQDFAYVPGEAFTRPCLSRIFQYKDGAPNQSFVYGKTYEQPNGNPLNLYLDSIGQLWVEDVVNSPNAKITTASVFPGLSAISATAFGREYIAFSDLLRGQWPPLQYDGTNFDRVTQDGPGFGPTCANIAPPSAAVSNSGTGSTFTISSVVTTDPVIFNGVIQYYASLTIVTTAPNGLSVGEIVTLSGLTGINSYPVNTPATQIINATTFKVANYATPYQTGSAGSVVVQLPTLVRVSNIVTATTSAAHGFQVGWQVVISNINPATIGGGIVTIARDGNGTVTVVTTNAHGLPQGAQINITGVTVGTQSFNGLFAVASVPGPKTFTFNQGGVAESGNTGNVQDVWSVTSFIQTVPSPTTFTYQDFGPNNFSNATGLATIQGQISPGAHNIVVSYLTRQGAITKPSPPVTFYANGNQQLALTTIPLGPSNIVARIISATGAGGDNYFTIPAVPQVGQQIVGSSLIIHDNTTTAVIIDFADNTLFNGIAIDQVGNDLFDQRLLVSPCGFYSYDSRLMCWGDWNTIQNLLNMTLGAGSDLTVVSANPTTGTNGGSGTAWTNPSNITSQSSYATVAVSFDLGRASQTLLAEAFGFSVANTIVSVQGFFNYYATGAGQLRVQLLKAGVATGAIQFISLPASGAGTSGSPLSASLQFPVAGIAAADVNNAAFGFQIIAVNSARSTCSVFVRTGNLTVSTSTLLPQGWKSTGSTSLTGIVAAGTNPGIPLAYQMTSAAGTNDCMIVQPAYQDAFGTAILSPNTQYTWRCFPSSTPATGFLVADIYSPSLGILASASVNLANASPGFSYIPFTAKTPQSIPADCQIRYYLQNVTNAAVVTLCETSFVYTQNPTSRNVAHVSYVVNPEGIAQTTGLIGSADDPSEIRCFSVQRNSTLLKTASGTHIFQANNYEPDQWVVDNLSRSVGACSFRAGDPGQFGTGDAAEDWDITVNRNGWYLFAGGDFWRISPEIATGDPSNPVTTWDDVNWAAEQTIVFKNDPGKRRAYCAVPVNGATQPNLIFVLDYKELDTATDLANAPSLKIGLTGRQLSTDKTRKWSRWNIFANSMDILSRPSNGKEMTFMGGANAAGIAFANAYTLDSSFLTDDDYGQMYPYYDTYGFVNHDQEQQLGLGSHRKFVKGITAFMTGTGYVSITPLVDSLQNPLPSFKPQLLAQDSDPSNLQNQDFEWTCGVRGERIFFRIWVQPNPGSTDVQLKIQKLVVSMSKDPVIQTRTCNL